MAINIEELRETLEINKVDMTNNRSLTNEYMIDDMMIQLGYNKRRDKSVKRLVDSIIDWEVVASTGAKAAVKVYAVGEKLSDEELNNAIKFCADKRFSIFIVTNGETITIFRFNKENQQYTKVCDINILEDINDTQKIVIESICKDTFNLENIDNIISKSNITDDDIISVIESNIDELANNVTTFLNDTSEDVVEQCKKVLSNLFTGKNTIMSSNISDDAQKSDDNSDKVIELQNKLTETEQINTELQNKLNNITAQLENIQSNKANNNENETLKNENETLKNENETLTSTIDELNEHVNELNEQLSNSNDSGINSDIQSEIDSYRAKIEEITNKYTDATEEIKELKSALKKAHDNIDNLSGADRQKALELLGVIEDIPTQPRSYVAVINTELLQFDTLSTFAGRVLQKLYDIKSYEASQYIFNGDIFKLQQPAERSDLVMNNKPYDLCIDGIQEDEVLNKLRIVFSHFNDIIFECKKIGSLDATENQLDNGDEEDEDIFDNSNNDEEIADETDETTDETTDENEFFSDESDLEQNNEANNSWNNEQFNNSNNQTFDNSYLFCAQLWQIDDLIWTDEPAEFNTIKYIGSSRITFNINMNNAEMSNEKLVCRCIDAVLALAMYNGESTSLLSDIRRYDLSQINSCIKLFTEEYANYPRINGTRYVVVNVESIQQAASIIEDICSTFNIDGDDIFLYFDVSTTSNELAEIWNYDENAVQLREYTEFNGSGSNIATAIIKGDIFQNIVITKNSLQVHKQIITNTVAVKTNYLAKEIKNEEDFIETVRLMVCEARKNSENINVRAVGNVIGEQRKLITDNPNEASDNAVQVNADGLIIYIEKIQNWQIPLSLIKIQTALLQNEMIVIKINVGLDALDFFATEFEVVEPSLSLAVSSFVNYISSCVKK